MRQLFVVDPLPSLAPARDTSVALMRAAAARGHEVWSCTLDGLGAACGEASARATPVAWRDGTPIAGGASSHEPVSAWPMVWMRKDPPVDGSYLAATWLLDRVNTDRCLVVNRPSGLRDCNEKLSILAHGALCPETIVTSRRDDIDAFVRAHGGRAVLKPLDLMGGIGVFQLRLDDPNLGSIVDSGTLEGRRPVMVQAFVPEVLSGDKRILLLDGEPLATVLRVPKEGEFRGNLHVGGRAVATELTARDHEICEALAPWLRARGLWFVGIDVIGSWLTEINVTSPTGIVEYERFSGVDASGRAIAWSERVAPGA